MLLIVAGVVITSISLMTAIILFEQSSSTAYSEVVFGKYVNYQ
jgi:hypothetical protein